MPTVPVQVNPCIPSPCGPFSTCQDRGGYPSCTCMPNYLGSPPYCRAECSINSDCTSDKACIREKCRDPCPGSCGINALCTVINHTPACTCSEGYTGDPFSNCNLAPIRKSFHRAVISYICFFFYFYTLTIITKSSNYFKLYACVSQCSHFPGGI